MTRSLAPSSRAVLDMVDQIAPVDLDTLQARAGLQDRIDHKFLVYPSTVRRLVDDIGRELTVLEIRGERQFDYDSLYFDSAGWRTYRDHVQGRRRRFQARTRHYVGSGVCMFEVKIEGSRGKTAKYRQRHAVEDAHRLTPDARALLDRELTLAGIHAVPDLRPAVQTTYRRTTLASLTGAGLRITIDTDLQCQSARGSMSALTDRVLIEVKSASRHHPVLGAFADAGLRPLSFSKYCVGAALLHPELPRAPWAEVLARHFEERPLHDPLRGRTRSLHQ